MKGRKRKSVRHDASSDAIGPDIPRISPEDERWDQWEENLGSCASSSFLCARRRRQVVISSARIAPKAAPGKKPAAIALLGKEGQEMLPAVAPEAAWEGDDTGVIEAASVAADVVDDEVVVFEVVLSMTQVLSPWQVYPNGQQ